MARKVSRNWNTRQDNAATPSTHLHWTRMAPGTVLLLTYLLLFQFVGSVHAQSVTLAWDPSTSTGLAGYRVYRSEQSGVFTGSVNASLLTTNSFTDSSVQSGHTYYYVVTSVSTTGAESGYSSQAQATIPALVTNKAPVANAGADQTITLPATATLMATASDDGLPNGVLTYQWSVVSGAGVTLTATNTPSIQATFAAAGTYTFRITVSDGQLSATDDVIVTVNPAVTTNKPPTVNAGADQTITLPATATLTATATDDGLPNGVLTYQWSVLSSGVTLTPTNTASTKATFSAAGTYTLRVTVSDGQLSVSDDVIVVVNAALTTNKAPTVNAGADQTIVLPSTATLTAIATDDGLPTPTLTYQWTVLSGTGVALSNASLSSVQVSFATAGTYTFRVTVSDGQLSASDDVMVVVDAAATTTLTLTVTKSGDTVTGPITPVYVQTTQVQTLQLLIDGQTQATTTGTSLTYRWKTNKVTKGSHIVQANALAGQTVTASKSVTVNVR